MNSTDQDLTHIQNYLKVAKLVWGLKKDHNATLLVECVGDLIRNANKHPFVVDACTNIIRHLGLNNYNEHAVQSLGIVAENLKGIKQDLKPEQREALTELAYEIALRSQGEKAYPHALGAAKHVRSFWANTLSPRDQELAQRQQDLLQNIFYSTIREKKADIDTVVGVLDAVMGGHGDDQRLWVHAAHTLSHRHDYKGLDKLMEWAAKNIERNARGAMESHATPYRDYYKISRWLQGERTNKHKNVSPYRILIETAYAENAARNLGSSLVPSAKRGKTPAPA